MKKRMTKITWTTLALVFAVLFPITTHAQAETAPDEYKADNMARIEALSAKTDFEGHFSLPYKAQCHMHKLEPGDYTVVVKTLEDGMKLVCFGEKGVRWWWSLDLSHQPQFPKTRDTAPSWSGTDRGQETIRSKRFTWRASNWF